jgi:hypothetical protein
LQGKVEWSSRQQEAKLFKTVQNTNLLAVEGGNTVSEQAKAVFDMVSSLTFQCVVMSTLIGFG